jgi:hypothetical protein
MVFRRVDSDEPAAKIAALYRRFADLEATGRSPIYEEIARQVATDAEMIAFLAALPATKWQPNLFFGAVQFVLEQPAQGWDWFRRAVAERRDDVAAVMRTRSTQTNLPARCATLLPALARLPQPLALLEVGAAAGLCLFLDRYTYDYGTRIITPATDVPGPPIISCRADPCTPLPDRPIEVVWRAGLDLNPLDVTDAGDRAWLQALVWPGEDHLRDQLLAAADIARVEPPLLRQGDLRTDLPALAAQAPGRNTLVIFHSAVLAYIAASADRSSFAEAVRATGAVWLANETPAAIPGIDEHTIDGHPPGAFLLCQDGEPLARTDPHGAWLQWLAHS